MKTLKNLSFGILAVVLGLGLVVTQSAFKGTGTEYHYKFNGGAISDPNSWEPVVSSPEFSCPDTGELPCVIEVDGSLSTYLSGKTLTDIMNSEELRTIKPVE